MCHLKMNKQSGDDYQDPGSLKADSCLLENHYGII